MDVSAQSRGRIGLALVITLGLVLGLLAPALGASTVAVTPTVVGSVPVGDQPTAAAVTPDNAYVYVPNSASNNVSVINASNNTVIATIPVGNSPRGVATSPLGTLVYVTNGEDGTVSVIDHGTLSVVNTIPVGESPFGVAFTPNGQHAYVANQLGHNVSIIDTATGTVTATVGVGQYPGGVAVAPDGARVYVTNQGDVTVSVIDTATNTVIATYALPAEGVTPGIAVSSDGTKLYVGGGTALTVAGGPDYSASVAGSGILMVINAQSGATIASVPLSDTAFGLAVTPDGGTVVVAQYNDVVSVIDALTNTLMTELPAGMVPSWVAISPDGAYGYVPAYMGGVTVLYFPLVLNVDARAQTKRLKSKKRAKIVKSTVTNGTVDKVKVRCLLNNKRLTGKKLADACKLRTVVNGNNVEVYAKAKCTVGLKVKVKIRATADRRPVEKWIRTWKVKNSPRVLCAVPANG